ncbi:MAG TPA: G1 family glutamic endopeptidase [Acidimicrobiales bacterium]|nr:G1 family glutamic endopeptidase [Acidimicrobiales bacterium]
MGNLRRTVASVLVALASVLGVAATASASTIETPAVESLAALPAALTYHGGTVTIAAQLQHTISCKLELLSHQAFPVVYATNWRPCTTALVAHVRVGANTAPVPRTVALDLLARDGSKTTSRAFDLRMAARPAKPTPKVSPLVRLAAHPGLLPGTGGTLTLSWKTQNAVSCSLSATGPLSTSSYGSPGSGTLAGLIGDSPNSVVCTGSLSLPIGVGASTAQKWTFTLTATNSKGSHASGRTIVTELPSASTSTSAPTTASPGIALTVSPTTLPASGGNVTVRYSADGLSDCTLIVVPTATDASTSVPCNGSQVIAVPSTPQALDYTFNFTGVASGSVVSATASLTQAGPVSTPGPTTTTPTTAPAPSGPPIDDYTSANWSGYVVRGSGLTNASGTFIVPSLYNTAQCNETTAQWVGIDGDPDTGNLIQAGITESQTDPSTGLCSGANVYYIQAFWEILPAAGVPVTSLRVEPGDSVTVSIASGQSLWNISVTDNTSGQGFSVQEPYSGPATSAEWITEAYTVNGTQTPVAPFSPVTWSGLQVPASSNITEVDAVTLLQGGNTESQPSTIPSLKNMLNGGFTTTYAGST